MSNWTIWINVKDRITSPGDQKPHDSNAGLQFFALCNFPNTKKKNISYLCSFLLSLPKSLLLKTHISSNWRSLLDSNREIREARTVNLSTRKRETVTFYQGFFFPLVDSTTYISIRQVFLRHRNIQEIGKAQRHYMQGVSLFLWLHNWLGERAHDWVATERYGVSK